MGNYGVNFWQTTKTPAKTSVGLKLPTQSFIGPLTPGETKQAIKPVSVVKTAVIPPWLGGGAYNIDPLNTNKIVNTGRSNYGGEPTKKGQQRDDIISVALGGANNNPANIRMEKELPLKQQTKFVHTPTDALESKLASQVKNGKVTLANARLQEMTAKQQQEQPLDTSVKGNFWSSFGQVIQAPFKATANVVAKKVLQPVADTLNSSVGERIGAIGRSIQQKSLKPLGQSFQQQYHEMNPNEPGISGKEKLNRITNIALAANIDAGMSSGEKVTPSEKPSTPKIESAPEKIANQDIHQVLGEKTPIEKTPLETQSMKTAGENGVNSSSDNINLNNKYVKSEPINVQIGKNDKVTAKSLREEYSGVKNSQIVRGNQLADEIKKAIPNVEERQGLFWNKAANGDIQVLQQALDNPKLADYHPQIEKALNLSETAKAQLPKLDQYYNESGNIAKELGTISNIRENYQNRIYQPEPPKDFVSTELKQGLKQTTSHAKARVFDTEFQAVEAGKKFATTDVADALSIHNEEMARVNASRNLAQTMVDTGLGQWTDKGSAPEGYAAVGNIRKGTESFVAPKGISKGLQAIADPDFTKKIDALRGIQKYQGLVKTVDLSYSLFHHLTMAAQTLAQGGFDAIRNAPSMLDKLDSLEFAQVEQDFTRNTGITTKVSDNQDVLRNLLGADKKGITNLPVIKQFLQGANKSSDFLFGKVQRFIKVMDYGERVANWTADHPTATNTEVSAFKKSIAKEVNSAYGGLNWEAMGINKSTQSLLRTILLAPDWTISNVEQAKMAFGSEGSAAAKAAWGNYTKAIVGGLLATNGLNKLITGHFAYQNPKGHEFELEISPNVYVSLVRGGPGDLLKAYSNIKESGPLQGSARFVQGKLSPFIRTAISMFSGVDYAGRPIYSGNTVLEKTKSGLLNLGAESFPIPFGASTTVKYLTDKNTPKTVAGTAAVISGLGRFSKNSQMNGLIQDNKSAKAGARDDIQSTYNQVQSLIKQGKNDEAQKMVDGLNDAQYAAYKQVKATQKAADTKNAEVKMFQTVKQVHDLLESGDKQKAQSIVDGLSDEDYRIYQLAKKKVGY